MEAFCQQDNPGLSARLTSGHDRPKGTRFEADLLPVSCGGPVMRDPGLVESIRRKYQALLPDMDERLRRTWAAAEALELQWGGLSAVAEATGLSLTTIRRGVHELQTPSGGSISPPLRRRTRQPGGGRKPLATLDPALVGDLERLVDPMTRGDPESPLRWTCKSTRNLADQLKRKATASVPEQWHPCSSD